MGAGASAGLSAAVKISKDDELLGLLKSLPDADRDKLRKALEGTKAPEAVPGEDIPLAYRNSAFVFVKPHANTDAVNALVKEQLAAKGIQILQEGSISGEDIDKKKLIDQHYYAIASKATILKPAEVNVPNDKFKAQFGIDWADALSSGKAYNAMDACEYFDVDAAELGKIWVAAGDAKKCVKLGGGFYCAELSQGDKSAYVLNAFFMAMRGKFVAPGSSIHYYSVTFDMRKLSWADFRGQVLGPTDPAKAPEGSLRGKILAGWEGMGLKTEPNGTDNGVHASASPFEGFAERMNWLGVTPEEDEFGAQMLAAGISKETIKAWSVDPRVKISDTEEGSLFDNLEDINSDACLEKALSFNNLATAPAS